MADILHQISIETDLAAATGAITTLKGLSRWWAPASGKYKLREKFQLDFAGQLMEIQVISIEKRRIEWRCVGSDPEWEKTRLVFKLKKDNEGIVLNFSHKDWDGTTSRFRQCNTQWAAYLLNLKRYLETATK